MPYVKPWTSSEKMTRLLRGYGLNAPQLAKILFCSETTARTRLKDPNTITTGEWRKIHRNGHIPIEEIREVFLS